MQKADPVAAAADDQELARLLRGGSEDSACQRSNGRKTGSTLGLRVSNKADPLEIVMSAETVVAQAPLPGLDKDVVSPGQEGYMISEGHHLFGAVGGLSKE